MKKRRVNPNLYTEKYYLNAASGYREFRDSWGKTLEPRLKEIVSKIPEIKGLKVLDIGCGRGELVFWAAGQGAKKAVGIDYSKNAIEIAKRAVKKHSKNVQVKVNFKVMDATKLEFPKDSFDAVFLIEVLEHLYPKEQEKAFPEILKVLKKNGLLYVHTAPSKWFNNFTYRFWCYPISTLLVTISNLLTKGDYGNLAHWKELRQEFHKLMHVNEPDYFSLKKLFRKSGFVGSIRSTNITVLKPKISWKDSLFNFLVYFYPLSTFFPFNVFWGNDFMAVLRKVK